MLGPDWTIAIDAAMCQRLTHCTSCVRPFSTAAFDVWQGDTGLCLAVACCGACKRQDPESTQLAQRMEQRYGARPGATQ